MTPHGFWEELAAGYALHGLSPDEAERFVAHLETCDECAASMKDHEYVAAQLGSMAHYREHDAEAPSWESMRAAVVGRAPKEPVVSDLRAHRRRRDELSRRTLAAAAGVMVVAGGGIAAWQLTSGGGSSCVASDGCHRIELDAAGGTAAASLVVRGGHVTMTPTAMTPAPAGKTYVLWQQPRDGRATPIGEFTAASQTPVSVSLRRPYPSTQQFAVSLERSGLPPRAPSNLLASGLAT
jgi:anti-sigma-K factor RskA